MRAPECHGRIRLVQCDPNASFRELLAMVVEADERFDFVRGAGNFGEALELCRLCEPEVLLVDPVAGGNEWGWQDLHEGLEGLERPPALLIHSLADGPGLITEWLQCEPAGWVHKEEGFTVLRAAMETIARGGIFRCPKFAQCCRALTGGEAQRGHPVLTLREQQVLRMIVKAYSSKQIAMELRISVRTVETHRANIMTKFEVHDVVSLVRLAMGFNSEAA